VTDQTSPSADIPGQAAAGHTPAQSADHTTNADTTNQTSAPSTDPWATTHQVPAQPMSGDVTIADTTAQLPPGYDPAYATAPAYVTPDATYVQFGDETTAPPRRGRRRTVLFSSVAVVVLAIGVGAYAGVRAWTGAGIAEPETAMPGAVSAFARIDVNPGVGDKLSVNGLVRKFPTHGKSATDLIAKMEASISKSAGLDFNSDVKPWFGGQAGVGLWSDNGKPVALIALSSKDDAKASATLSKLRDRKGADSFGFAMEKGYALIAGGDGDVSAEATAAAKAAEQASLADNATFKSTVAHVGNDNLLLGYADLDKLTTFLGPMLGSLGGSRLGGSGLGAGGGLLGGLGQSGATNGRIAIGGKVLSDGVELRVHVDSPSIKPSSTKVMSTLKALPSATIVGGAIGGIDPSSDTAKTLQGLLGGLSGGGLSGGGLSGGGLSGGGLSGGPGGGLGPLLSDGLGKLLTSKELSFAFTGQGSDGAPGIMINVDARDEASANTLMADINQLTNGQTPPGLNVSQNGTSIKATIGSPASGGSLGSSDLFNETMNGMSDASGAFYLDVQKLVALTGKGMPADVRAELAPVKAIGFSSSGSDLVLRAIIK
jgi:hypothetical protein